jgi:hypothetical protein
MTSALYEEIVSQRGTLENLIAKIPGFKGYHEKNARRQADTMLRDHIATRIQAIVTQFVQVENVILGNGSGLRHMARTREIKSRIQSYADRVQTAAPKYSGMFASIKIGNEELDRIYAFDEAQLRYVDRLETEVGILKATVEKGEAFESALNAVADAVNVAIDAFALRDDVILQLGDEK